MTPQRSSLLAWGTLGLCFALYAANLAGTAVVDGSVLSDSFFFIAFATAPAVGALLASRLPQNPIGWLLLAGGLSLGVAGLADTSVRYAVEGRDEWTRGTAALAHSANAAYFGLLLIMGVAMPLLFPGGRFLSRRWRFAMYAGVSGYLLSAVGIALKPNPTDLTDYGLQSQNPFGLNEAGELPGALEAVGLVLLGASVAAAGLSLVVRFRHSTGDERQQLKWFAFAGGLSVCAISVSFASWGVFGWGPWFLDALNSIFLLTILPASIGVAVLRYRLYDIDRIISRTVAYGVLTLGTLGLYVALVVTFGWVVRGALDQGSNELAVAATTLIVAALFQPARRRIQLVVDRRFYRSHYDAARTLEAFQDRLRHQTDLEALRSDVARTVSDAVRPAHVFVWLRSAAIRNDLVSPEAYRNARMEHH